MGRTRRAAVRAPAWPAFLQDPAAPLGEVVDALDASEHWSAEALALGQRRQRARLAWWSARHTAHWRELGGRARELGRLTDDANAFEAAWQALTPVTKADLRAHPERIYADAVPAAHEPLSAVVTSGSTGTPVEVRATALARLAWDALTMREHRWQRRDFSRRLGVVRYRPAGDRSPQGRRAGNWGRPVALLTRTGPASVVHVGLPVEDLARWLRAFDPHYLLCNPSVVAALVDTLDEAPPALEQIRCMFEPLDPELEARLARDWGVRATDTYSANETGYLAFRCHEGTLHVQEEAVYVEILREDGSPCEAGEWGRVVATPLLNLATPLLRYELGDFAVVGEPCRCGRASRTLGRVLGRVRNLARAPDGRRFWPVALNRVRHVAPVRQAQFVQTSLTRIELRAVVARPLAAAEIERLVACVRDALEHPFDVDVVPVASLPVGPTGKFEEFVCAFE